MAAFASIGKRAGRALGRSIPKALGPMKVAKAKWKPFCGCRWRSTQPTTSPMGDAGSFLYLPCPGGKAMPDQHFIVNLRDRLPFPECQGGARCQHCRPNESLCKIGASMRRRVRSVGVRLAAQQLPKHRRGLMKDLLWKPNPDRAERARVGSKSV